MLGELDTMLMQLHLLYVNWKRCEGDVGESWKATLRVDLIPHSQLKERKEKEGKTFL